MSYSGPFKLLYINPQTGEIKKITELKSADGSTRYWFPSVPVMSDDAVPVINLDDISFDGDESLVIPVAEIVSDADNLSVMSVVDAFMDDTEIASVAYNGLNITVTPLSAGNTTLNLSVNSNGKTVEKEVPVRVPELASADINYAEKINVYVAGSVLYVVGATSGNAVIYDASGIAVASFELPYGSAYDLGSIAQGAYIVRIETGNSVVVKKIVKL